MAARSVVRIGAAFPHGDPGFDTGTDSTITYVAAVEDLEYDYLTIADHVFGADPTDRPGWTGRYDLADPFREVFVHLGFLAALTELELVPSAVVLPQRQTGIVAKQSAELAQLCRGGFRLGVSIGWNRVEFAALGARFSSRAVRFEEQIKVLRSLWSEPVVSYSGPFHELDRVGIAPRPAEPIPIWIGGGNTASAATAERIANRIVALGDGWISPPGMPVERFVRFAELVRGRAEKSGRDPATIGIQLTVTVPATGGPLTRDQLSGIRLVAPTHVTVDTRSAGRSLAQHVDDLAGALDVVRQEL